MVSTRGGLAEEKKNQILGAATRLLTKSGLQSFSFEAVAKEAELSRQLVRYYYPDLDSLIADLCDHLGKGYQNLLVAGIVKVGQVERLEFFKDFFFGMAADHPMPDNLEVYDSFFSYAVGSDLLKERLRAKYKTLAQVIMHELAIVHPELDGQACEELSFLFVSMMHAHWSFVATLGFSKEHNQITRNAIDRLIKSYLEHAPDDRSTGKPWAHDD